MASNFNAQTKNPNKNLSTYVLPPKSRDTPVNDSSKIVLQKVMARPPGTSFLGSRVTTVLARIGGITENLCPVTIDSGSDITLISKEFMESLKQPPKPKKGQKVQLIQVTGKSSITEYVVLPILFETQEGLVEMTVEAYVVTKMNTPFILGNDFASQFKLSIIRKDQTTQVVLGSSDRQIEAQESDTNPRTDDTGNVFFVEIHPDFKYNLR
jgi:hypothetical protein